MAIIEQPPGPLVPAGAGAPAVTASGSYGIFRRPVETTGWKSWLFTVDHKKIGILYGVTSLAFFIVGGIEALLIRMQLFQPDGKVLNADLYNQMFTMHATTMLFLFIMPMAAALANYMVPLQIGTRDVAFPRLNALSYWTYLFGALVVNSGWFLGGAADGGWFMYAPNSSTLFSPSHGIDLWTVGLQITGIASLIGAINLIVTILNLRAPGMSLLKMPIFTWLALVTQFLLLFAIPVVTVALFLLQFQRNFGATFFDTAAGADPLLWQHLFWIFGHPEVYIVVMPAFGIASEILPVFARKPLFGYPMMVFSSSAIGFLGWGVWAHHMFASGLGPISVSVFSIGTMLIAIPTGIKVINWVMTMWGGKLWLATPALFIIGMVVEFTLGGLSGVTHAASPSDTQQTDTYYVVAHFHYVFFGASVFAFFAAFYYWWPKFFGRLLDERLGKIHFWLMFIGMNLTFGPMHILGMQGQPRRMYRYSEDRVGEGFFNLTFWNQVATVGAFVLAVGVTVFIVNTIITGRKPRNAPLDPWDARSVEWLTANPPKPHNFDSIPTIHALDEFFHRKYAENDSGELVKMRDAEAVHAELAASAEEHIELPAPSYWPILLAASLVVVGYGAIYNHIGIAVGVVLVILSMFGWAMEPSYADRGDYDPPADAGTSKELAPIV